MSYGELTSEGPDRCRKSLACQQFFGTDAVRGGSTLENCCCCNPCTTVRPGAAGDLTGNVIPIDKQHCCHCVPRGFFVLFTPTDEVNDCCYNNAFPVYYDYQFPLDDGEQKVVYQTFSGYGVVLTVEVGKFPAYGYGYEDATCKWRIKAYKEGVLVFNEEYEVDHVNYHCMSVPEATLCSVTDWRGCNGVLSLQDFDKAPLPYVWRQGVWEFPPDDDDHPYDVDDKFQELCDPAPCSAGEVVGLTCISVQGVEFAKGGTENGLPYFLNDDWKLYWTGDRWVVVDTLNGDEEVLWGDTDPTCPFGIWLTDEPYGA